MSSSRSALSGMRMFTVIALGQFASLLGSGMTAFGIGIWAWEKTGQATALALAGFFFMAPMIALSPFAGAIVDRSSRKLVMVLSDAAAGVTTVVLLTLLLLGRLEIWHIYVAHLFSGAFQAFQFPAFSAAITTMLTKEQYGRANGMRSMAEAASQILAPTVAAFALGLVGIEGIMAFDLFTLILAITTVLMARIPQPKATAEGAAGRGSLIKEAGYGFRYIFARPSLLGLQLVFFCINLVSVLGGTLRIPMILARTGNNQYILGTVQSLSGVGMLVGGLAMSAWGGPKKRVNGVLGGMLLASLLGYVTMGVAQGAAIWAAAGFAGLFFIPIINGSNQAIWQAKVAPDVQGRVFSVRLLIAQITAPVGTLLAGPLADKVFEPAMMPGGALASTFGRLVGTGPGAGMSFIFLITGLLGVAVAAAGYLVPAVRNAESLMPDHDVISARAPEAELAGVAVEGNT